MGDAYSPPRAPLGRDVRVPLNWTNAIVALLACAAMWIGVVALLIMKSQANPNSMHWDRIVGFSLGTSIVPAFVALHLGRIRWYWIALVAPPAGATVFLGAMLVLYWLGLL